MQTNKKQTLQLTNPTINHTKPVVVKLFEKAKKGKNQIMRIATGNKTHHRIGNDVSNG